MIVTIYEAQLVLHVVVAFIGLLSGRILRDAGPIVSTLNVFYLDLFVMSE